MRVLLDHPSPFALAHGGFQVQIEQTAAALRATGVDVDYLRWWDPQQNCDLIHYFGRPSSGYVEQARQKGLKVVVADLLTGLGSRDRLQRMVQKGLMVAAQRALPGVFTFRLGWDVFRRADALVALTPWEAQLMREMFGAPPGRTHVVPNGVEEVFLHAPLQARGEWLVCTATITERKRVLELVEAAVRAQTPVWIIGRPYSSSDPYARRFEGIARQHPRWVRYEGAISERARLAEIYSAARGFVLLSAMESLSLSALEAAACGCPLLLSDLPWARTVFGTHASYCPISGSSRGAVVALREFYAAAPRLAPPPRPMTWIQVAEKLRAVYETVLSTSR
jgi:glycosyltransferase involved in cell wall biosynthesis